MDHDEIAVSTPVENRQLDAELARRNASSLDAVEQRSRQLLRLIPIHD